MLLIPYTQFTSRFFKYDFLSILVVFFMTVLLLPHMVFSVGLSLGLTRFYFPDVFQVTIGNECKLQRLRSVVLLPEIFGHRIRW